MDPLLSAQLADIRPRCGHLATSALADAPVIAGAAQPGRARVGIATALRGLADRMAPASAALHPANRL